MEYKYINEKSLKMNPYQYFNYCQQFHEIRGVAVVTDKQSIFYSQVLNDDDRTHDNIMIDIEKEIHSNAEQGGFDAFYQNHVYLASLGRELKIFLPNNEELSLNQARLICSILDEVEKINQENDNSKIKIDCFGSIEKSIYDISDVEKMKKHIESCVTKNQTFEEEKIIGKVLSEQEIENNIRQALSLSNFSNLIELMNKCSTYYNDSFYQNIFIKVFPDYEKIKDLVYLCDNTFLNKKQGDITFETVKTHIKNRFKTFKNVIDIRDFFCNWKFQKLSEEAKQNLFPDYSRFYNIFQNAYILKKLDDRITKLLEQGISYEDFARELYAIEYNRISMEMLKQEEELKSSINRKNEIKREEQVINSKDQIKTMINKKAEIESKQLDNYSNELELNMAYQEQTERNNDQMKQIQKLSSSKFKRIIYYKKIKREQEKGEQIKQSLADLERRIKQNNTEKEKLAKVHEELKVAFTKLTNLDFFLSDISELDYYFKPNYEEEKKQLDIYINMIKQRLDRTREELIGIASSSLLKGFDTINLQQEVKSSRGVS